MTTTTPPPSARNYLGECDPNAILRGEIKAQKGDTLICESIDMCGWIAFRFNGHRAAKPFTALHSGTKDNCQAAARQPLAPTAQ